MIFNGILSANKHVEEKIFDGRGQRCVFLLQIAYTVIVQNKFYVSSPDADAVSPAQLSSLAVLRRAAARAASENTEPSISQIASLLNQENLQQLALLCNIPLWAQGARKNTDAED